MFLFDWFRSFLPLHNPIGFGASDFIELALAGLLILALAASALAPFARRLAERPGWSMLLVGLLPIALRLALLPHFPVPTPAICDEFSYLLSADTLAHFRLANPPHPLPQFFETLFVLQSPSYSSIYPLGQGIALAIGRLLFGHPWAGVLLSVGLFCALCYWMLRGWTSPAWALAGGLLAVCEFGPLNLWMNCYWGGGVSAIAGCLVFGALPRLVRDARRRDAALLGLGLGLQLLSRPYESVLLDLCVLAFFAMYRAEWPRLIRLAPLAALALTPALALTLLQNRQVTGNWTTLPYMLSRYQYGIPTTFTFQPNPVPHVALSQEEQVDYDMQSEVHGAGTDSPGKYLARLADRVRFYRFFFLAPLYVALPLFFFRLREKRFAWVALALAIFALGTNLYPYFYPHYIAAVACLLMLVAVTSLQRLSRWNRQAARLVGILCAAHFLFWYGLHFSGNRQIGARLWPYESWDNINRGDPDGRITIRNRLAQAPGRQLVFVHYGPQHLVQEWVQNGADIDAGRVVWADDLGASANAELERYYPDRKIWLLEADATPPKLVEYPDGSTR